MRKEKFSGLFCIFQWRKVDDDKYLKIIADKCLCHSLCVITLLFVSLFLSFYNLTFLFLWEKRLSLFPTFYHFIIFIFFLSTCFIYFSFVYFLKKFSFTKWRHNHGMDDLMKIFLEAFQQTPQHNLTNGPVQVVPYCHQYPAEHLIWYLKLWCHHLWQTTRLIQLPTVIIIVIRFRQQQHNNNTIFFIIKVLAAEVNLARSFHLSIIHFVVILIHL